MLHFGVGSKGDGQLHTDRKRLRMPGPGEALPGRAKPREVPTVHYVSGNRIKPPFPHGFRCAYFGMGCFWGAERQFWGVPGVYSTAVGYQGGLTPNPTYPEVCTGATGSRGSRDDRLRSRRAGLRIAPDRLLGGPRPDPVDEAGRGHRDPVPIRRVRRRRPATAPCRGVAGIGTRRPLAAAGFGAVVTEIAAASEFYYAEEYHQQYLAKNLGGYCGLGGTGVECPSGVRDGPDSEDPG